MGEKYFLTSQQTLLMKKFLLLSLLLFSIERNYSQEAKQITHLKNFFLDIPIDQDFNEWINYIANHLGIDSSSSDGIYSSIKENTASHFPFPDSIKIKVRIFSAFRRNSENTASFDKAKFLFVEGIFGNTPDAKKQATKVFKEIVSSVSKYYKNIHYYEAGSYVQFRKGINENFPDCEINTSYYDKLNFYYVTLSCAKRETESN